MAVPVRGKVILDTNVFVDYLRQGRHAEWVFGRAGEVFRFLSSVVLMELRLGADTPRRKRAVDRIRDAFPSERLVTPAHASNSIGPGRCFEPSTAMVPHFPTG